MTQPTTPLDRHHPDPIIQRLLDWLKSQIANLFTRLGVVETNLGGFKIIRGIVDATSGTPSITEGTGFTITDNGPGDYTITFTTPFSDVPAVVTTSRTGASVNVIVAKLHATVAVTASAARVVIYRTDTGAAHDGLFHFIAIGPA